MLKKVHKTITDYHMIDSNRPIIIGVSGGPDSMVLVDTLSKLVSNTLIAFHLNHQFRGEEAEKDALFVKEQCEIREIPVIIKSYDVPAYIKETGLGSQEAARKIRYQFYLETAIKNNTNLIALGHHANDQAETIMMRILRGTGTHGLAGIPYVRDEGQYKIIRPLLDVSRDEIEAYASQHVIAYRTDKSNLSMKYFRNEIRLEVLPSLMKYNQKLIYHLHYLAKMTQDEDIYLNKLSREQLQECLIEKNNHIYILNIDKLQTLDIALQRRMIHLILNYLKLMKEITFTHIDGILQLILDPHPSKSLDLPGGRVYRNYNQLIFTTLPKDNKETYQYEITVPGEVHLQDVNKKITTYLTDTFKKPDGLWAVFDYDVMREKSLTIRSRIDGDRLDLLGMKGSKKVKDIFIDQKIPRIKRDIQPLLVMDNKILWIPGIARSRIALINDFTTSFLFITVEDE